MLFDLEHDTGSSIRLYLGPDSFSVIPQVSICVDGSEILQLEANQPVPAFIEAKRHETGICGFLIDDALIPGLAGIRTIEIFEKSTGVLIYRRNPNEANELKLFRLETRYLPNLQFDRAMMPHFHYSESRIERFGFETVMQMLHVRHFASCYLSGRIHYRSYEYFIEQSFSPVVCLTDPFVTLAERLLTLASLKARDMLHALGDRDALLLAPAAEFVAGLPFQDGKGLRKALRHPPDDVKLAIANPVTRLLTARLPGEMPQKGAVAAALDVLSSFKIVDTYDNAHHFRDAVATLVDRPNDLLPVPSMPQMILNLAELLREEARADHLIELDMEIYERVQHAIERATSDGGETAAIA